MQRQSARPSIQTQHERCHTRCQPRGMIGFKPKQTSKHRNFSDLIASAPPATRLSGAQSGGWDPGRLSSLWLSGCCSLADGLARSLTVCCCCCWLALARCALTRWLAGGFEVIFSLVVSSSPTQHSKWYVSVCPSSSPPRRQRRPSYHGGLLLRRTVLTRRNPPRPPSSSPKFSRWVIGDSYDCATRKGRNRMRVFCGKCCARWDRR
jgi:hypothetical protein